MDDGGRRDHVNIFLSYTRRDGSDYAHRFYEELMRRPGYSVTYDELFRGSQGFDRSVEESLGAADIVLVLLTARAHESEWVRNEVHYAAILNKHTTHIRVIVARLDPSARPFIEVGRYPYVDFSGDPVTAWERLHEVLERESAPANGARPPDTALGAPRDERHAEAVREAADLARMELLRAKDLAGARERLRHRVEAEWRREAIRTRSARSPSAIRFVNEMPELPEIEFQDRLPKMARLDELLRDPAKRLVLVTGDGGTGKTAFLREYRRRLANGIFTAPAEGFVYLAVRGYRQVSAAALLNDLAEVPNDEGELERVARARPPWRDRLAAVLDGLGETPVIVAIDDAEELLDEHGRVSDRDLRAVLTELITRPGHRIRVLMVVRQRVHQFARAFPQQVDVCDLAGGLPAEHTTPFLRALDSAQLLAGVPDAHLRKLAVVSDGNPRFLELAYALLRIDPDLTPAGIVEELSLRDAGALKPFPRLVFGVLARLERTERRIVQALAVYGRPVHPEAVDYLLDPYVPGIDSAPMLVRLTSRRIVRQDGDRYVLPPVPDAGCVRAGIPDRQDGDGRFTLRSLRRRAGDFYAQASAHRPVRDADDLDSRLREIELRIAAGDHVDAVHLMEEVDEEYLTGWGQSGILLPWREAVDKGLEPATRIRAANLSYLVSALAGEEDHTGRWTQRLEDVLAEPWLAQAPEEAIRFGIQLADLWMDSGRLAGAAARYDRCARRCTRPMRYEAVMARVSRGICLARLGAFDDAGRDFEWARKRIAKLNGAQRAEAEGLLHLNEGWMLGQLGDPRAVHTLQRGLAVARTSGDQVTTGRLLDGLAALYCDTKEIDRALEPALEAARIAVRAGHQELSRNANVTLALVYLLADDMPNAVSAAQTAVQQPPGLPALAARAVEGVVHLRRGDVAAAASAFHAACTEAWLRLERAPDEYAVHDAAGLALTGLHLCGEPNRLARALDLFTAARRIATAKGARRRIVAQLSLLEPVADQVVLETARCAADGDADGARGLMLRI